MGFIGTYELDNYFALGGSNAPASWEFAQNLLAELTDDEDIDGDDSSEDFGQDPGAYISDFLMRETCAWECRGGEDYASCSLDNHHYGDISALYTEDFSTWSAAAPGVTFGCGAWEIANRTAQQLINGQLESHVPQIAQRLADSLESVHFSVSRAKILSELTLDVAQDDTVPMVHELRTMVVSLSDLAGIRHEVAFDLRDVGLGPLRTSGLATTIGNELRIRWHSFPVNFGVLVRHVYMEVLLPLLGFESTAEMLASWTDCESIAEELYSVTGGTSFPLSRMQYFDACTRGIERAGAALDDELSRVSSDDEPITLEGRAWGLRSDRSSNVAQRLVAREHDGRLPGSPDTLDEGHGSWVFPTMHAGQFTGELQP